jgi:hypothetical protein
MNADHRGSGRDSEVVSFPNWKDVLAAAGFAPEREHAVRQEIFAFLRHCKTRHAGASIMLSKDYLRVVERQDPSGGNSNLEARNPKNSETQNLKPETKP